MLDPALCAALATVSMLLLLAIGVPVAISMGIAGLGGLIAIGGWTLTTAQMQTLPYNLSASYAFAVLPTFLFMGNLIMNSGIATELYSAADKWLGHLRGGLYLATISGSAGFAAISGSPLANTTVATRVALPEMLRLGYSRGLSGACIASAGTLAAMIPPSIGMVVYGILTEQSIGKLMVAGVIPGIMTALGYCFLTSTLVRFNPALAPQRRAKPSFRQRVASTWGVWPIVVLFLVIMAGIYGGFFSPSAAGAVGAFASLIIVALRGRLTWKILISSLKSSAETTAMLFIIVIAGLIYSRMLVISGLVTEIISFTTSLNLGPVQLLLLLSGAYIILGCLMDGVSMLLITMPFVFPVVMATGIDPILFGILVIVFIEIGAITPPIGLSLFATVSAARGNLSLEEIIRYILPFVILNTLLLVLFIIFPEIVLWAPQQMAN